MLVPAGRALLPDCGRCRPADLVRSGARACAPRGCTSSAACPATRPTRRGCPSSCARPPRAGSSVVQLREKHLPDDELTAVANAARALCERLGALLIVNDRPQVALEAGADGVHVGQDDMPVEQVRELVGPEMLIGLSTHAPAEIDAADPALVDYIGVGPVHETPTKPGRPAVGLELVRYAAANARVPFFAIGGLDAANVGEVIERGRRADRRAAGDRRGRRPAGRRARAARPARLRRSGAMSPAGRGRDEHGGSRDARAVRPAASPAASASSWRARRCARWRPASGRRRCASRSASARCSRSACSSARRASTT